MNLMFFANVVRFYLKHFHYLRLLKATAAFSGSLHCRLEGETARERTGNTFSYAEAEKMKWLKLHAWLACS